MEGSGGERAWLLYDGDCAFCTRTAAWVVARDRSGRLRVVAYQEAPSPPMTPELWEACAQAVHVVTPRGRTLRGGDATIYTLGALGWRPLARLLWLWPLRDLVGFGYRIVASMRGCSDCGV